MKKTSSIKKYAALVSGVVTAITVAIITIVELIEKGV
jgi:hypothetical protein|tara:strand:- start:1651 stop:1761 length:111 start_codon:yes stop_codon:yes gene_type:complete